MPPLPRFSQSPRDAAFVQDPYPFYGRARAAGPLFDWEEYGFPCAAGYREVSLLLRDRRFGREPLAGPAQEGPAHLKDFRAVDTLSMLDREPPAHTRLRGLVLRAFTSRRIAGLEPEIGGIAADLLERLATAEQADLIRDFAEPLPVIVISRLLGVPDAMAPQLLAWSHAMVSMYQARRDRTIEEAANTAAREFSAWLRALIEARRHAPADDLLTHLIVAESGTEHLSTEEMIATFILLLNAGHEATVHAIGNGVRTLLQVVPEPAAILGPGQIAGTCEEILRHDPPLHLFTRIAREDVALFGHQFRRGETVGCLLAAANRDPAVFPEPDRFLPRRRNAGAHLSFGAGIHFCLGAPLARLELRVAIPALFARFPKLALAAPPRFADRFHFRGVEALPSDLTRI